MNTKVYRAIQRWAGDLEGVFTLSDLRVALGDRTEAALYKRLTGLVEAGILIKVKRGIYATPEASLAAISCRIEPAAYISTGTILAKCAAIGSIPVRKIQAIKTGRPRTYVCKLGTIEHLSLSPRLYFGFVPVDGVLCATPEKAFLDVCYFTYRGRRFSFDPESDVNTSDLKRNIVSGYLKKYDPRFVNYFNRIWGDKW
ncbi:MAG: type IV toxin-antitoxin system AbiEi family antitoxin domain-containing protein [Kiritimatiellia bacterium]